MISERDRYRNPPPPLGYIKKKPELIMKKKSNRENMELIKMIDEMIESGLCDEPDISRFEHFTINSDSEEEDIIEIPLEEKKVEVVDIPDDVNYSSNENIVCIIKKERDSPEPPDETSKCLVKCSNDSTSLEHKESLLKSDNVNESFDQDKRAKKHDQVIKRNHSKDITRNESISDSNSNGDRRKHKKNEGNSRDSYSSDSDSHSKSRHNRRDKQSSDSDSRSKSRHRRSDSKSRHRRNDSDLHSKSRHRRRDSYCSNSDSRSKNNHKRIVSYSSDSDSQSESHHKKSDGYSSDSDSHSKSHKRRGTYSNDPCNQSESYKIKSKNEFNSGNIEYAEAHIKQDPLLFGEYRCEICQITVNSEIVYDSHIKGKRHLKALEQAQKDGKITSADKSTILTTLPHSKYPETPPGCHRLKLDVPALVQSDLDSNTKLPYPGLDKITEIRGFSETSYYCSFCDILCSSNCIIQHLNGFKHQLNCLIPRFAK